MSTNNGTNWTQVNNGLSDTTINALAVSGVNIIAGTNNGVFLSTNNGTNWTQVNNGLTDPEILSLAVSGTNIFAGTYGGGVLLSTNNGTSWAQANNGLISPYIYSFAVSGTYIFAGTYGRGVWRRPLSELEGVSKEVLDLPREFSLSQNYPNPFNPSTTINYSIGKEGHAKITVYNIIGSKVAVIVDENKSAGSYSVQFNSGNLSTGVYFYKLESDGYSDIKKLVVIK
jgi:hypothetical protein